MILDGARGRDRLDQRVEAGLDAGVELAERYVLTPLGSAMIAALVGLLVLALVGRRSTGGRTGLSA